VDTNKIQSDLEIKLKKLARLDPNEGEWVSSDLHVHQNYGGTYKNDRATLVKQAEAEGVDIVHNFGGEQGAAFSRSNSHSRTRFVA